MCLQVGCDETEKNKSIKKSYGLFCKNGASLRMKLSKDEKIA